MSRLSGTPAAAADAPAGFAGGAVGSASPAARRLQMPVDPEGAGKKGQAARRQALAGIGNELPVQTGHSRSGAGKRADRPSATGILAARLGGMALGILVAAVLAAIGLAMVWFNVSGLKQAAVRALKLDQASWVLLEERRAALDKATAELSVEKRSYDEAQLNNERAASSLLKREKELDARQAMIEERTRQLTGHELSLQSLKAVYEGMDPVKAAAMAAVAPDRRQLASVLKAISQARLSLILEQMPPETAAELIALMTPDLSQPPAAGNAATPSVTPAAGKAAATPTVRPSPSPSPKPSPKPSPSPSPKP